MEDCVGTEARHGKWMVLQPPGTLIVEDRGGVWSLVWPWGERSGLAEGGKQKMAALAVAWAQSGVNGTKVLGFMPESL